MTTRVLVVDDDAPVRDALMQTLELADLDPVGAGSFVAAKDLITSGFDGVVLSDIRMPGKDGFDLLEYARGVDPDLPVILLTGEGDIPMAVKGINAGAFDFLEKPCGPKELLGVVEHALRTRALVLENRALRRQLDTGDAAARMIAGASPVAQALRRHLRHVARGGMHALITGEPGTGTARGAEVIHLLSDRSAAPFLRVTAATASPASLSDAFAAADQGSIFIDELVALPQPAQFALLELMGQHPDTPVRAASYHDLDQAVTEGTLTPDLFYRLEMARVHMPSLADRPEDIPILFRGYVAQACEQAAVALPDIPEQLLADLVARDWPGNARALQNVAMRFALGFPDLRDDAGDAPQPGLADRVRQYERTLIVEALRQHRGNASETARALDLPRKTFYDKLARHGLKPEDYR